MNPEDIERALRKEKTLVPSADFTARVMRSVRQESADLGPLRFPWGRALPGLTVCAVALGLAILGGRPLVDPHAAGAALTRAAQAVPLVLVLATFGPPLGSWIVLRLSLRLAGYRA